MKIKLNIIKGLGILILVASGLTLKAQQDPMYTQYMFNTQTMNPAYAGTWESLSFMVLARQQWAGLEGAPKTYTFSMQAPLKNERFALGLDVINDKIGLEKRFYVFVDYSYLVQVDENNNLRLGLKGGFTNYTNDLTMYSTNSPLSGLTDPAFQSDIDKKFIPNFGVGAFLYGKKYYMGFSVPKLINHEFNNNYNNYSVNSELRHYFLMAGLVFNLGENLKFKPTMLAKASFTSDAGSAGQVDLTANFLIKEKFWLGAMYRTGDSFGFIAHWIVDKKLQIGYAFDYTISNIHNFQNGTHEIMVSYQIKLRDMDLPTRYF
jgi:type IX secretion system PorP/SprF family membrane protein